MNIYVGQLPYSVTEDNLRAMFAEFGELESVRVISDRITGRSKGFGFVEMASNSEADTAMKSLNGKMVDGRSIKVIPADSGAKRPTREKRPFGRDRF
ncbi:MAG: RNA-binding protein [Deltaproteobacteria bacterium HGW-Deltaproteobacteria-21]|jgi:RNA recognition motif-containing protein|nr:MAG: RNA-binding protein [Deltaproteobacteria bacterium HGW-Deltaproteobacteria-21]